MKKLNVLFGIICLLGIAAPMLIQHGKLMTVRGLEGYVEPDTTKLSYSWWNGDLQKRLENAATDSLLIYPACVRARNQFEYAFFGKLNATDVYAFDGYFYRFMYPDYNERDEFLGETKINATVQRLKAIQEQTKLPVYVVIAPNKMRYYSEHLPEINRVHSDTTNYTFYKRALQKAGIEVLDAHAWHLRNKKANEIPILAKEGVHWTLYAAAITMDSLIKRLRSDLSVDFQGITMEVTPKHEVYKEDVDLANLSNLMYRPVDKRLRNVYFPEPIEQKRRMRPVVIGDSFYHVIEWSGIHHQLFQPETPFYYYFHTRYTNGPSMEAVKMEILQEDLKQADCIIILTDIQNMSRFGFGFIEQYPL